MKSINDYSLVLSLPFSQMDGGAFASGDCCGHRCVATGTSWDARGRVFNGAGDYVDCGTSPVLDLATNAMTLEVWFMRLADSGGYERLVTKSNDGAFGYLMDITDAEKLRFSQHNGNYLIGTTALQTGRFYYGAGTYDGSSGRKALYLNGQIEGTLNDDTPIRWAELPLWLGRLTTNYGFNGIMGEVRLYNRALSAPEIMHNYTATKWRYR